MKKFLILFTFLIGFGLLGIFIYKINKNYGFFSRESVNYYEANPQKSGNYYKANYYKTVPNYYKANSENADNYVNPSKNPPENYYKAPSAKKPTTREGKTMEAIQSGFK
jgi:hypothetical protein